MITLLIPPKTSPSTVRALIKKEKGTASCIKSNTNRKSVQNALSRLNGSLSSFKDFGEHGLAVFCGTTLDSASNKMKLDITLLEPIHTIPRFLYHCGSEYQTSLLSSMLSDDQETFGLIIVSGVEAVCGTIKGPNTTILQRYTTELPKKQKKGGQSAPRFQRCRV